MTEPNVYRRAADLIRIGGHTKRAYERENGSHCIVGAVQVAKYGSVDHMTGRDEEIAFLADLLGGPRSFFDNWTVLIRWNDADERTPEDVVGLLEQAAEKKEAEQS